MNSVTTGGNCTNTIISQGNTTTVYKTTPQSEWGTPPDEYYSKDVWKLAVKIAKENNRDPEYAHIIASEIDTLCWSVSDGVHDAYN